MYSQGIRKDVTHGIHADILRTVITPQ